MLEWDIWLIANVASKFAIYLTSFLALGSLLFLALLKPSSDGIIRSMLKLSLFACILSAIFTIVRISIQAGQLYDEGFAGLFDPDMIGIVVEGPLGPSSYIRLAGLALLLFAILIAPARIPLTIIGGLLVCASFAIIGHATKNQMILGSLIIIHLLAVSYWLGGLYPLYKLAGQKNELKEAGELAHTFGKQAAMIVPVLILAGILFSVLLVGSPAKLLGTSYGLVLGIKIAVVAVLLGLAALNKFRFVPNLLANDPSAAQHFQTSIKFEFAAFLIIFAVTAILTTAVHLPDI